MPLGRGAGEPAWVRASLAVVALCGACGAENRAEARFCDGCGSSLGSAAGLPQQRKTVTVVFCDLVGSTALGESRDLEAVQLLLARYFERMRAIVERHGGAVEKFIGDAVVAVFGVPVVHEDDAMRAVRAAAEMQAASPELGLEFRVGVNTGEVVASRETLVTGDAVNVAARLEQAAAPGEILLGAETHALVRDAVRVEALTPLDLKGKQEPVEALRLLEIERDAPGLARRLDAPMVGRAHELQLLGSAFENAVRRRGCALFTLLGSAGVGKSRLAREFLSEVDAEVVEGQCLSYGEGITYFPVVEVVKQLGGTDPELLAESAAAAAAIGTLLGERAEATTAEEIAWAVRKLLEARARDRPLVVVFDDIHWGEPTFLDLVEHVADQSREAAILVLCLGRLELLDGRPGWAGGKLNATTVLLEPLDAGETDELIDRLQGGEELEAGLAERIRVAADGNPLFVEEMLAMVLESGKGEMVVPPTVRALLAARLDQLDPGERSVLERGSIEGPLFHTAAVEALAREPAPVGSELAALVRKELVRPDRPRVQTGEAYRFRHLLIRDAAYEAVPKAMRADLHERLADWLEQHGIDLVERDEMLGYHLEQANRYRTELDPLDDGIRALGERAAGHLVAAGRRAANQGDYRAEVKLFERALELGIADPREHAMLQLELGLHLGAVGRHADASRMLTEAFDAATRLDDRGLATVARLERAGWGRLWRPETDLEELRKTVEESIETLEELGDERHLPRAYRLLGLTFRRQGRLAEACAAYEQALRHADASADQVSRREVLGSIAFALLSGPAPVGEGIRRCEEMIRSNPNDHVVEATVLRCLAPLVAMAGRSDEARELVATSGRMLEELDLHVATWVYRNASAEAKEFTGDRAGAQVELQAKWQRIVDIEERTSNKQADLRAMEAANHLALLYCDEGSWEDAERCLAYSRDVAIPICFAAETPLRLAGQARLAAHRGRLAEASTLAHEAVELAEQSDMPNLKARVWLALAEVEGANGRSSEGDGAVAKALDLYERKGNVAAAERLRAGVASA